MHARRRLQLCRAWPHHEPSLLSHTMGMCECDAIARVRVYAPKFECTSIYILTILNYLLVTGRIPERTIYE
jgi:hypothetical protein